MVPRPDTRAIPEIMVDRILRFVYNGVDLIQWENLKLVWLPYLVRIELFITWWFSDQSLLHAIYHISCTG